jgi:hypothetical protein
MPSAVHISSASEFRTLLSTSTVVIADCKLQSTSTRLVRSPFLTFCSLRRLVRPLQSNCAALRTAGHQTLQTQICHLHKSKCRLAPRHRPPVRRLRHADLRNPPLRLRRPDPARRRPARPDDRGRKRSQACGPCAVGLQHTRPHTWRAVRATEPVTATATIVEHNRSPQISDYVHWTVLHLAVLGKLKLISFSLELLHGANAAHSLIRMPRQKLHRSTSIASLRYRRLLLLRRAG